MSKMLGEEKATFLSLPPNLQNDDTEALSYAVDRQIKKLLPLIKQLIVWGDLDSLDPKYYDQLAASINAAAYRSEYTNEQKLMLIKTGLSAYYALGTRDAVEGVLSSLFSDSDYLPWWEYGGEPYHFKVRADDQRTFDIEQIFIRILRRVKAAREIMDSIETIRNVKAESHIAAFLSGVEVAADITGRLRFESSTTAKTTIGGFTRSTSISEITGGINNGNNI